MSFDWKLSLSKNNLSINCSVNHIISVKMSDELRGMMSPMNLSLDVQRYWLLILHIVINKHFNGIIIHNYSNTQMKVYAKDSMDRLGDDLTELHTESSSVKISVFCPIKTFNHLLITV